MDSIRGLVGVSIAQLAMLSGMVPAFADINDGEEEHRKVHGQRHAHAVSHSREDYPVIWNWLTTPETQDGVRPETEDNVTR